MSILADVRLGLDVLSEDYDPVLLDHINAVLFTVRQLGVPVTDIVVGADTTWTDLVDVARFSILKTYIIQKVRLLFDPPSTGYLVTALTNYITEAEGRLIIETETGGET